MRLMARAQALVMRRLERIEQAARAIPGVKVERSGEVLTVRTSRRRWVEDARLRFLGIGR